MAWKISKGFRFEASHQLKLHDGKCANLHGHSYVFYLTLISAELKPQGPETNMVTDYYKLSTFGKHIEDTLDHKHLNDVLGTEMPTAEFIAQWIYREFAAMFHTMAYSVEVKETESSSCVFCPWEN
jgi:6-pyruvoyltetrahydropterin/6-carboxytetrahydropterin synthase